MSERTTMGRGGAPAPRTQPAANAKPSELERARMRRVLEGPSRPTRRVSVQEQSRADAVLSELKAVRYDVACLRELVADTVGAFEANAPVQCDVLTRVQVAELLSLSIETVTKLVRDDSLPCKHVGKEYRFLRSEVLAWLRERDVRNLGGA
jgi:excisionase family DNA binding protein